MKGALTFAHLNMVRMFPGIVSWVPRRRRERVRTDNDHGPHTRVMARDEARFHAWLGQNVPAGERSDYAFLAGPDDLDHFRGRVLVLPGAWSRPDANEMVELVEARVHCGAVRWAA